MPAATVVTSAEQERQQQQSHPLLCGSRPGWMLESSKCDSFESSSAESGPSKVAVSAVYRHDKSGMRFVLTDAGSSMVHINLAVPTSSPDDRGIPHTLEHLVFKGSQRYPKPGTLQEAAARLGTADLNAFTTHHFTAYILTAVSAEATFSFLPILLDHVLHPLLSDDNFVTEVYHVKPDGNGGGVVYSEVLSQHMNASYICRRFMEKYLSPPDSPFHYNHGGDTDVIPDLTNHDIIEYHRRYYDPRFMVCTITGGSGLTPEALFDAIDGAHGDLLALLGMTETTSSDLTQPLPALSALPRPICIPRWPGNVKHFESHRIGVPCENSSENEAKISYYWFGVPTDSKLLKTVDIILVLLTRMNDGPLYSSFCAATDDEGSDSERLWASRVQVYQHFVGCMMYWISFSGVDVKYSSEELPSGGEFNERFRSVLQHVLDHGFSVSMTESDSFDSSEHDKAILAYIHSTIDVKMARSKKSMELNFPAAVHNDILSHIHNQYLYSFAEHSANSSNNNNNSNNGTAELLNDNAPLMLPKVTDELDTWAELKREPISYWRDVFKQYFVDAPCLELIEVPSQQLVHEHEMKLQDLAQKRVCGDIVEPLLLDHLNEQKQSDDITAYLASKRGEIIDRAMKASKVQFSADDYQSLPSPPDASSISIPSTTVRFVRVDELPSVGSYTPSSLPHCLPIRGVVITETKSTYGRIDMNLSCYGIPRHLVPYLGLFNFVLANADAWIRRGALSSDCPLERGDADFYNAILSHSHMADGEREANSGHLLMEIDAIKAFHLQESYIRNDMCGCDPNLTMNYSMTFKLDNSDGNCNDNDDSNNSSDSNTGNQQLPPHSRALRAVANRLINIKFEHKSVLYAARSLLRSCLKRLSDPPALLQHAYQHLYSNDFGLEEETPLFDAANYSQPISHFGQNSPGTLGYYNSDFAQVPFLHHVIESFHSEEAGLDTNPSANLILSRLEELREFLIARNGLPFVKVPVYDDYGGLDRTLDIQLPGILHVGIGTGSDGSSATDKAMSIASELCAVWSREIEAYYKRRGIIVSGDVNNANDESASLPYPLWFPPYFDSMPSGTRVYAVSSPASAASHFKIGAPTIVNRSLALGQPRHDDCPATQILITLLSRSNGPLFNALRGGGFSYSARITADDSVKASVSVKVGPAAAPVEALKAVTSLLIRLRDDLAFWEQEIATKHCMDAALAQMEFAIVQCDESTTSRMSSMLTSEIRGSVYKDLSSKRQATFEHWRSVTAADLRRVFEKHVLPIVDPNTPKVVVWVASAEQIELHGNAFAEAVPGCASGPIVVDPESLLHTYPIDAL